MRSKLLFVQLAFKTLFTQMAFHSTFTSKYNHFWPNTNNMAMTIMLNSRLQDSPLTKLRRDGDAVCNISISATGYQ